MPTPWWLVPRWLDLELARYLAACEIERTREEVSMADTRTQQQKLNDKHPPVPTKTGARQQDAKHQGPAEQKK